MALKKGDSAPDFTLQSDQKEKVTLSDYKGKNVVLLFFPLAFTGTCTEELCSMRDNIAEYEDLNAEILAVSVDSMFTLDKFKQEQSYNFPLLSDFNKEAMTAYDTKYDDFFGMNGVAKRSAFVIDKEGKIQYAEVLEDAGKIPNFDAVQETLKNLK